MYIHDITSTQHFVGSSGRSDEHNGIVFDSFEEAAAAVRRLGVMLTQDPARVDKLLGRMEADIAIGMTHSPFAAALMRGADEPAGPVTGTVTLAKGGWLIGSRHAVHNDSGLQRLAPFENHSIRINKFEDGEGATRYRLKITDLVNPMSLDPSRVGLNYTECLLAAELGQPRPLVSVHVNVFYEQHGPEVDFGLVPLLDALGAVDGLELVTGSPESIAEGYFVQMRDENYRDFSYQVVVRHANGCGVLLAGFSGIQEHRDTIGRQLLLRLEGDRLAGPYDDIYRPIRPHVTFVILAPRSSEGTRPDPDGVLATNQSAIDLAAALTTALWSNNVG